MMMPIRRRPRQRPALYAIGGLMSFFCILLLCWPYPLESTLLEKHMNDGVMPVALTRSSFDWSQVRLLHNQPSSSPSSASPIPHGRSSSVPRIQAAFDLERQRDPEVIAWRESRRRAVRNVFARDWQHYRNHAWGKDAVNPITGTSKDQFSGWAATLVDSLDALWIMGFRDEFDEAVAAVAEIDFGKSTSTRVNIFETTIRYLGGLLAAYDLSKRPVLLAKAVELGDFIYAGFNTPNRMPVDFIDFERAKTGEGLEIEDWVVSASPGSLCMEFTRLSQITGDSKYFDVISPVMKVFHDQQSSTRLPGLFPIWVSMKSMDVSAREEFTLGASADSVHEYLPKMIALLGGKEPMYESMTREFMQAADRHLFFRPMVPGDEDILISGNVMVDDAGLSHFDPESEHLACFAGGAMALGGRLLRQPEDVETGGKLTRGCAYAYSAFPTGMMPERFDMAACLGRGDDECRWDDGVWEAERAKRPEWKSHLPKGFTAVKDGRYLLRPEAIESVFVNYRITGDPAFQDMAWQMFEAVASGSEAEFGHGAVKDVTMASEDLPKEDYMESFWLAETLKYFYLVFSPPDVISLDEYVLNTEAHPFRLPE